MKRLRKYLITGLVVWLPIAITYFVLDLAVAVMDWTLVLIPPPYRPEALLGFRIPGLGLVLTFVLLLLTGMLTANLVGRRLVRLGESVLARIPFVRSVYSAAKSFAELLFTGSGQSFKKVMLVQFPRAGMYSLAFQTSNMLAEVQHRTAEEVVSVFIPTTPNPTTGFLVMVPRSEVIELDMEVEAALKMIMSLGVVVPAWAPSGESVVPVPDLAKPDPPP